MPFILGLSRHRKDCKFKQEQRSERIRSLTRYHGALTDQDKATLRAPIEELVRGVHEESINPVDILLTYGKVALKAHAKTNCLTEVMLPSAEAALTDGSVNLKGPLAGIPVSLKDTVPVAGYDSTVGYSSLVGNAQAKDGPIARLLKDTGAVPYVKTNIPITLLSFESTNDVWGRTTNPHNSRYSPGGSTGGEAALLALGGRIGIGSDVAGSVRLPAAWSGCYSLRCSTGRWPKWGVSTSMPGQEGVPSVYSPMARTLDDLTYFTRSIVGMEPWKYDHTVHPLPWRGDDATAILGGGENPKKARVGVMRSDGVVDPSPACARALSMVEEALRRAGHDVFEMRPPGTYEALRVASLLLNADGCGTFESFMRSGEWQDRGVDQMSWMMKLARPFKYLYYLWVKYVRKDDVWAGLVRDWHPKSTLENWKLVGERESYRFKWFEWWNQADVDFLLTVPNATPALPHDAMKDAVSSCGYTFLFNYLDYTAGVLPVTRVDKVKDKLPATFNFKKLNGVAQGAYKHYDAEAMHGLPVGVQIIGRRLEEEKVLAAMKVVEDALGEDKYQLLEID
ncbi:hypothetical protein RB595_002720 [Gaeumannomyces hyphopodioides]